MARALLLRGMLAGLVAGVIAFVFARLFGEPSVSTAISFGSQRAAAGGAGPAMELVSRDIQSTLGLLTAVVVYGVALGGLFSLVFTVLYGRVREASPGLTARWLAAGAFAVVYLVPFLKYPANPPAVGRPETIGTRTALYVAMLVISLGGAVYALWLSRRLEGRLSRGGAALAGVAVYLLVVLAGVLLLPGVNEVPAGFPAVTLWNFRLASIGIQVITWATIGLVFGFLASRVMEGDKASRPAVRSAVRSA
jgi:hypothetical protein